MRLKKIKKVIFNEFFSILKYTPTCNLLRFPFRKKVLLCCCPPHSELVVPASSPTPNRRCYKPYYQDNKQSFNILILVLFVGLRCPTLEVEEASELGEWLLPHLGILACSDQMNLPKPVAQPQAHSVPFSPL